ncbi:interleukin-6 receptor subunit alpha [Dipodomys spectabilis]|uniref:interleukin-6 receptor subunit alpha n=1 Tax=Dipodomys spectabilis TaxID=105255 RepID=UPI001C547843|nr:interleukin-6 receptor subunit alpha [Dipodomys spectabilis]
MLAGLGALLGALLAAAPGAAGPPWSCRALEAPSDVLTSLPGASVTLTCPVEELSDNTTVHWLLASSPHKRWAGVGKKLLLRSVELSDTGNYSCYLDGHLAGTVHLLVDVPPRRPQLFCFRKSLIQNVTCEWSPQSAPSPMTEAVLFVEKFQNGPVYFQEPCQYFQESQKFSCQFAIPEGDQSLHSVTMCIANSVGSKLSENKAFRGYTILKPDPPTNIKVTAMPGNPRWLNVTWQDPHSWNSDFYRLHFELRYRAEWSKSFTTWLIRSSQYRCIIQDALRGTRHVVQLRAQEEFGLGQWSNWSQEVLGTPWTESRSTPAVTLYPAMQTTAEEEEDANSSSPKATSLPVQDSSSSSLPTFLAAGGSLAFGSLLCIGIILRLRRTWKSQILKEDKASIQRPCSLEQPKPTIVLVPLLATPMTSGHPGSISTLSHSQPDARNPQSAYDMGNRDCFFPR